jgi:UDP-N-acetylmuramoyl-tripeptide--D-alanyl-D-alanine ligase
MVTTNLMGIDELSFLLKARHISFAANSGFSSVSIDSRAVKEGALFFALEGACCDGHEFVQAAFDSGASGAVVASCKLEKFNLINAAEKKNKSLIVVENTKKSLQDSAKVYLEKFPNLKKVGITGSCGKTTAKEITAAIISCEKNTVMNKGNLNSETGLPLSAFEVRDYHEVGVFELGMNRPKEILEIAEVLCPNIAAITNIGSAHIENFGSKLKIVNEKKCIFNFLKNNDTALIPANDEYAGELSKGVTGNIKFYSQNSLQEFEGSRSLGLEGTEIIWAGEKVHFAVPGKHSLENAITAIAIAKEINVSNDAIKKGLESVKPLFGRLEILKGTRATVIRDCYNANPESAAKSVEFCDSLEWAGRKVYIIADMLELGGFSASEHEKLGDLLSVSAAEKVFLFGEEIKAAVKNIANNGKSYFYSSDITELSDAINSYVKKGDLALLKGSRGCALERLSDMLTGACNVS